MKDTEVLKRLYELQGLKSPESAKFISDWIKDIQMEIANDSKENIGHGNAIKTMTKCIKANTKKGNGLDGMLQTSKRGVYILTDAIYGVKCKADFGLPVLKDNKSVADKILSMIDDSKKTATKKVTLPPRAELDAIIKDWKAKPKDSRSKFPEYDFGKDLPKFNAEELYDLLSFFPMVNTGKTGNSKNSCLYLNFTPFEAIILPINKK